MRESRVEVPEVRFADAGGVSIAWQQFGSGPDVLVIPPLISNCELVWEHECYRRYLEFDVYFQPLDEFPSLALEGSVHTT